MYSDDFNWRCDILLVYSHGWQIVAISYKDIATPYELLSHLDIVAIYAIATEIFHCTSAWLHLTYVVAKSTIATLALVSVTTKVVASTTYCHTNRRCNKPTLSQLKIVRCHPGICDTQILYPTTLNLLFSLDIATKMGLLWRFWGVAQRAFPSSVFNSCVSKFTPIITPHFLHFEIKFIFSPCHEFLEYIICIGLIMKKENICISWVIIHYHNTIVISSNTSICGRNK